MYKILIFQLKTFYFFSVIDTMMKYLPQVEDEMEDDDVQLLARLFKSPMFRSLLKVSASIVLCF